MNRLDYIGLQQVTFACNYGLQYRRICLCNIDDLLAKIPWSNGRFLHRHVHPQCGIAAFATSPSIAGPSPIGPVLPISTPRFMC